jgi:hypothetical protein
VDHVPLKEIPAVVLRACPPVAIPEALIAFAHLAPEGEIDIPILIERQVFHVVESIHPTLGVLEVAIVLLVPEELVLGGRLRFRGISLLSQKQGKKSLAQ